MAYGKIYRNKGAMTHGVTEETPDGMSLAQIDTLIEALRYERFEWLMRDLLAAGYLEDWTSTKTLSGVPQGGIVSPILSNILLDQLDTLVAHTLLPQYTRGTARKVNLEHRKLLELSRRTRRPGNTEEAGRLRSAAQKLPSAVTADPDDRRLNYVRYADDFLLGFIGPKSEAETIKQQLKTFLREAGAVHRAELLERSDYALVMTYQLEYRGRANS